jgi:hypothetical protein
MSRHLPTAAAATLCNEKTSVRSTSLSRTGEQQLKNIAGPVRLQHFIVRVDTNDGHFGVAPGHPGLQLGRAGTTHSELDEKAIASRLNQSSVMRRDHWVE